MFYLPSYACYNPLNTLLMNISIIFDVCEDKNCWLAKTLIFALVAKTRQDKTIATIMISDLTFTDETPDYVKTLIEHLKVMYKRSYNTKKDIRSKRPEKIGLEHLFTELFLAPMDHEKYRGMYV